MGEQPADARADMRFVRMDGAGEPEVLVVDRTAVPRPGPGELLIAVTAAGVNRPDVLQRRGLYPPPPDASPVLGLEVSGTVAELGDGVAGWAVGDAVCALVNGGGYAEFCVAPAAQVLPLPAGMDAVTAAGIPETFFTVWHNVFERGRLLPGERLLVHGGSSGIGSAAIQLAHARGAVAVATAGSADKCAYCESLGARRTIDYRAVDGIAGLEAAAREAADGDGYDVILDMVGGEYIPMNIRLLRDGGRLVQIAFLNGSKAQIDFMPVMRRRLTLTGSTLRPRTTAEKGAIAAGLRREVWPLLERGAVRVPVHATFPLAEAAAAHRLMESSTHMGKILLTVDG